MRFIFKRNHNQAQSTILYVALFVAVITALVGIHAYMRRGFQGRYRALSDDIGTQYEPGATTINNTTTTHTYTHEYEIPVGGGGGGGADTATAVHSTSTVTEDKHEAVTGY